MWTRVDQSMINHLSIQSVVPKRLSGTGLSVCIAMNHYFKQLTVKIRSNQLDIQDGVFLQLVNVDHNMYMYEGRLLHTVYFTYHQHSYLCTHTFHVT